MHPPKDGLEAGSGGISRRFKVVLIVYMVVMSILSIDVLVTEGIGKSAVGPVGALFIGVLVCLRARRESSQDPTS